MAASRKPATDLNICNDLTVKYTVTVTKECGARYKKTGGYVNHIRFYLYSSKAKKQVGKDITASHRLTQKQYYSSQRKTPKTAGTDGPTGPKTFCTPDSEEQGDVRAGTKL